MAITRRTVVKEVFVDVTTGVKNAALPTFPECDPERGLQRPLIPFKNAAFIGASRISYRSTAGDAMDPPITGVIRKVPYDLEFERVIASANRYIFAWVVYA